MKWRIAALVLCLVSLPAFAGARLVEGRDYVTIDPQAVNPGQRVEVIEFFFYSCQACYLLEPVLRGWVERRASQIDFRLIPALRSSAWIPLSDFFFALHSVGALSQLHHRAYIAIHEQSRALSSRSEQIRWVAEYGVDPLAFELELDSDATKIATQQARDATIAYDIRATPSIVFDGRYVTTGEMIGNASRVAHVLDGLLEMALSARGRTAP